MGAFSYSKPVFELKNTGLIPVEKMQSGHGLPVHIWKEIRIKRKGDGGGLYKS